MRSLIIIGIYATSMLISTLSAQTPVFVNNAPTTETTTNVVRSYSTIDITRDLKKIKSVVPMKAEGSVLRIIRRYLYDNKSHTEEMIGRAYLYFPMIERLMAEHDAPEEMKYLAIIESSLKPVAKSRVGARGMWQFMPATAREYGLVINEVIDERLDPEKSTVAAIRYLKKANNRFKSWTLSLAAYNSGGGRVNRAVRRAHSKNFWKLKRFLPKETRSYVPAYIAASYVMKHYNEYGLNPVYPSRDMYLTTKIKLNKGIQLHKLGEIIGVKYRILRDLNPQYFTGYVPAKYEFNVPESANAYIESYFNLESLHDVPVNVGFSKVNHLVTHGQKLWDVAKLYHCTPQAIMDWNGLTTNHLTENTSLVIYKPALNQGPTPIYSLPTKRKNNVKVLDKLPKLPANLEIQQGNNSKATNLVQPDKMRRTKIKKYTIRKTTSLYDMANWLDMDLDVLLNLNKDLVKSNRLSPGTIITVPGN